MDDDDGVPNSGDPPFELSNGWKYVRELGKGGNGVVVLAERQGVRGAYKRLKNFLAEKKKPRARFISEIQALEKCQGVPGVIPLLDAVAIKDSEAAEVPWLVMAEAKPMPKILSQDADLETIVRLMLELGKTLAAIHSMGISHRDIKPDNCLFYKDRWHLGDFGLADFEGKKDLTAHDQKLGSTNYLAPEMLNSAHSADGKAADVYSFAKLFWKLATGQNHPLPGHQPAYQEATSLAANTKHPRARLLDVPLERATDIDPANRPSMDAMVQMLEQWLSPPREVPKGPIALTNAKFVDLLADNQAHIAAEEARRATLDQRRLSIRARWLEPVRNLINEVTRSLEGQGIGVPKPSGPHETDCTAQIELNFKRAQGSVLFMFSVYVHIYEPPNAWVDVSMSQDFAGYNMNQRFEFLAGSATEEQAMVDMVAYVHDNLQGWVDTFVENAMKMKWGGGQVVHTG
jgi:serine/threonine protein kinase